MAAVSKKALETVKDLDLKRYVGRWYEIASIPSNFQPKNTVNTRATYTLKDDGNVGVLNETFTREGKRNSIEGKVTFLSFELIVVSSICAVSSRCMFVTLICISAGFGIGGRKST
jgi:lipocalin